MKFKIFDKISHTIKRNIEKKQGILDKSMQMEIGTYINKSKELLKTAKIIGIEHDAGKHSIKSIDELKQQISTLQNTGRKLQDNLKEVLNLPRHMKELLKEQTHCIEELNRLKQENNTLDKLEKKGIVKKSTIDKRREINGGKIKDLEEKVKKNKAEIEDFHSGNTVKTLKENVNNNLHNFKKEVAKLEFKIRSIEKGPAPKPPIQPSRPAPFSPTEIRDNLKDLAGYFNDHGAYDAGKQYLQEKLGLLSNFGIIDNYNLQNMQNSINKSDVTGQELIRIINTVTESIDHDLKSRMERPVVGNRPQPLEERFVDKFAGKKVENMKENNQKNPTFVDRVKERMKGNTKENDQETYRL